jgi:WD40 repeat protein
MPAYNMEVSPDGRIAALYAGEAPLVAMGVSLIGYVPDENLLPIRLIDLTTGNELGQLTWQTDYTAGVAFTPDGRQMASYHRNGDIYLWDIASRTPVQRITAFMGLGGEGMEFLPDGKTLVVKAGGTVGQFLLWDVETGYITDIWRVPYESYGELTLSGTDYLNYLFSAFDISPDGALLATATLNGEVMLWDTATLEQTLVQPKASEPGRSFIRVMFSADSKTLVYFDSLSQQTHFWDVASRAETTALSIGGLSFGLSPRNDVIAWATREELWLAKVDQPDLATKVLDFPEGQIGISRYGAPSVTFTPDGHRIVVGDFFWSQHSNEDGIIYVITLN